MIHHKLIFTERMEKDNTCVYFTYLIGIAARPRLMAEVIQFEAIVVASSQVSFVAEHVASMEA